MTIAPTALSRLGMGFSWLSKKNGAVEREQTIRPSTMPGLYGICAAGKRISVRGRTEYNVRRPLLFRAQPRATCHFGSVIHMCCAICVVLNHRSAHAHAPVRTQDQASRDRRHQIRIGMAQHEQKRTDAEVTTEARRAKAREEFFLK